MTKRRVARRARYQVIATGLALGTGNASAAGGPAAATRVQLGDVEIGLPDPLDTLIQTTAARPTDCDGAQAERLRRRWCRPGWG